MWADPADPGGMGSTGPAIEDEVASHARSPERQCDLRERLNHPVDGNAT